jgi:hypothetical protein
MTIISASVAGFPQGSQFIGDELDWLPGSPAGAVGSRAVEQETRPSTGWSPLELALLGVLATAGWPGLLRALEAAVEAGHLPAPTHHSDLNESS